MVRNFPTRESSPHNPLPSYTINVAFVAAIVTLVSSLCGIKKKKHRTSSPLTTREPSADEETQTFEVRIQEKRDNPPLLDLPPPPAIRSLRASSSYQDLSNSNVTSQKGKLSTSMSMKSIRSFKKASKREEKHEKNKLSHEDSLWKKTIILGEKCRVPDDEEEPVVYDEKGMRIPTFHRKQTGLNISRLNSTFESDGTLKDNVNRTS